jgi:HEAT repeat protein
VPTGDALTFYEYVLRHGLAEARCAVCCAVEQVYGDRADHLILFALDDESPSVQAAAARQIRQRQIKGAAAKLVERLDSPHDEVRDAVRDALSEFSFENYVAKFDDLDEQLRKTTGALVRRIDAECPAKLRFELSGPLRVQRRRAIGMSLALGLLPNVSDAVVELLSDEDPTIREAAAHALQHCTGSDVRAALVNALQDCSASVQTAAKESLADIDEGATGVQAQSASNSPGRTISQ